MRTVNRGVLTSILVSFITFSTACAVARAAASPSPSPAPHARQALDDAWWTGPLLAPGAGTLPRGALLVEPYVYDVIQYGSYDRSGALQPARHANTYGSLTYVIYGLADRVSVGVIPTVGYTALSQATSGSRVGLGDWAVLAQYRLSLFRVGHWMPTSSVAVQETLPTGRYDNLGNRVADGQGSGTYSTKVSFYTQSYFWMRNGRILRGRLNFSQAFSGHAKVDGASVYGTPSGFHGDAKPGDAFTLDAAAEYSASRNWVLAGDLVYENQAGTRVTNALTGAVADSGDAHSFAFAPALEYNWSPNVGAIFGVRFIPAGVNASASVTPVFAVNYVR